MPPSEEEVLTQVAAEVKRIGTETATQIKTISDGFQTDLADARKLYEDGKADVGEVKAFVTSATKKFEVVEDWQKKQEAIAKKVQDEVDAIVTAMRRSRAAGFDPTNLPKATNLEALEFKKHRLSVRGEAEKQGLANITLAEGDAEAYAAYTKAFNVFCRKEEKTLDGDAIKALTTGSDPSGGYLVPPALSSRIMTIIYETSPLAQLATVETIGSDRLEISIDEGEGDAGWVGEEEARPTTNTPTVGVQTIYVHEIYAKPKATQRVLEDASTDLEAWLATKNGDKMARIEASALINGNGVKKPRGLLTYTAGTVGTYERGKIPQVNSGASTSVTADGIKGMPFNLKDLYHANARWLMKRSTLATVALFKDQQNQYLWVPGLSQRGADNMLVGYPISLGDDMPALGANALSVAFGDFRRAYTVVRRLGITTLRDPYSSKPFVEFYSRMRVGGDVTNFEAVVIMKCST